LSHLPNFPLSTGVTPDSLTGRARNRCAAPSGFDSPHLGALPVLALYTPPFLGGRIYSPYYSTNFQKIMKFLKKSAQFQTDTSIFLLLLVNSKR
jgi:hypothetical protein